MTPAPTPMFRWRWSRDQPKHALLHVTTHVVCALLPPASLVPSYVVPSGRFYRVVAAPCRVPAPTLFGAAPSRGGSLLYSVVCSTWQSMAAVSEDSAPGLSSPLKRALQPPRFSCQSLLLRRYRRARTFTGLAPLGVLRISPRFWLRLRLLALSWLFVLRPPESFFALLHLYSRLPTL